MPNSITTSTVRESPTVTVADPMSTALSALVESGLPAIPVLDPSGRLHGIFGEREFITALFPGYLDQLGYAGFVTRSLDETIARRSSCVNEPIGAYVNTEHVDVSSDAADAQVAEVFLHHRVLIVPVTERGKVVGVVTRSAFFRALAERVLDRSADDERG